LWEIDWVALATFALAVVTGLLVLQVKAQLDLSRTSEAERRGEVHILQADPLDAVFGGHEQDPATQQPILLVNLRPFVGRDRPALAVTGTIRSDDSPASQSIAIGTVVPGGQYALRFRLEPFVGYRDPASQQGMEATVNHLAVVIESRGLFGQRVIQTYRYRLDRVIADTYPQWYMERQEIIPNVAGATAVVVEFDG
jgi:hypothetical protein